MKNSKQMTNVRALIEGSDSKIYRDLIKHPPNNERESEFIFNITGAINGNLKKFNVPVFEPVGEQVGYSYKESEIIANENSLRIGTKKEYLLFLGTIIHRLILEGLPEVQAWYAVCTDSQELLNYSNLLKTQQNREDWFQKYLWQMQFGKCRILANDNEMRGFWLASSGCNDLPLAFLLPRPFNELDYKIKGGIGWFVC